VAQLANGIDGNLQVVVDPNNLRDPVGRAKLVKFHGCVVHAAQKPTEYRPFLIGSASQITNWQAENFYEPIRREVISVASNERALITGLSLQDANLQWVFARGKAALKWPWPCPDAPAQVFCEDKIGAKQQQMLKTLYGDQYEAHSHDIEASALLRSYPEQVLLALSIKLLVDKIDRLLASSLEGKWAQSEAAFFSAGLRHIRNKIAANADGDRTAILKNFLFQWSKALSLFRSGMLPDQPERYQVLSPLNLAQLAGDPNVGSLGIGEAGAALGLIGDGEANGDWVTSVGNGVITSGAITVKGQWAGASSTPVFLVSGAAEAIRLGKEGAFANDNAVVIHSDDAWLELNGVGKTSARRSGRKLGRTGSSKVRHVSIRALLDTETTFAEVKRKFKERVGF
jgi:hypothetical protein